jgi:hypothetical protein
MSRKTYRWIDGVLTLVAVDGRYFDENSPKSATIQPDIPGYVSPVTGQWIEGRKARREDLRRTGSRPYEGRVAEEAEAAKYRAEQERKTDQLAERMAHRAWAEAPESVRRVFRSK